jgi:hypothetical protein
MTTRFKSRAVLLKGLPKTEFGSGAKFGGDLVYC